MAFNLQSILVEGDSACAIRWALAVCNSPWTLGGHHRGTEGFISLGDPAKKGVIHSSLSIVNFVSS